MLQGLARFWALYKTAILIVFISIDGLVIGSLAVISNPQPKITAVLKTDTAAMEVKFPPANANLTCDSLTVVGQDINNQATSVDVLIDGQSFGQATGNGLFSVNITNIKQLAKGNHSLIIKASKNGQIIGQSAPENLIKPTDTGQVSCTTGGSQS